MLLTELGFGARCIASVSSIGGMLVNPADSIPSKSRNWEKGRESGILWDAQDHESSSVKPVVCVSPLLAAGVKNSYPQVGSAAGGEVELAMAPRGARPLGGTSRSRVLDA